MAENSENGSKNDSLSSSSSNKKEEESVTKNSEKDCNQSKSDHYEELFSKRFTDEDEDFKKAAVTISSVPIVELISKAKYSAFTNKLEIKQAKLIMIKLSGDETQIYDRQIRLWGIEAQNRLRSSTVLVIGLSGLGAEVAKNLMLSGLKSLTLMDDKEVSDADFSSNFLISAEAKNKNRAEACYENVKLLNPMVELIVLPDSPLNKTAEFFAKFDLVIALDQDYNTTNSINKICRQNRIRFQAGGTFGWAGYAFFDFNNHAFLIPKPKEPDSIFENVLDDNEDKTNEKSENDYPSVKKMKINGSEKGLTAGNEHAVTFTITEDEDSKIKKNIPFPSFEQTFAVELGTKRFLRRRFNFPGTYFVVRAFLRLMKENCLITKENAVEQWRKELQNVGSDESKQKIVADDFSLFVGPSLCPVCAIVGSITAQEAIKALSQNDIPLKSSFFYSVLENGGTVVDMA